MRTVQKRNNIIIFIPFVLMLLCLGSIGVGQKWPFIIFACIIVVTWIRNNYLINFSMISVLWIYSIVYHGILLVLPRTRISAETISVFISAFISMGFVLVSKPSLKAIRITMNIFICLASMIAVYVIFVRTFPNEYLNFISARLDVVTNQKNIDNLKYGYGPAIGSSYTLSVIIMIVGFFACLTKDEWKFRFSLPFVLGVIFAGIVLYGRKGELLACTFAIILYFVFYFFLNSKVYIKVSYIINIIVFFIILITIICFVNVIGNKNIISNADLVSENIVVTVDASSRIDTFKENIVSNNDPSSGRFSLFEVAFRLFKEHPFLGYGWQQFANYKTGEFNPIAPEDPIRHTHNDYLQMLFDIGILGTILMYGPLIIFLWEGIRVMRYYKQNKVIYRNYLLFCAALSAFFILYGAIDPVFHNPITWIILGFISSIFGYCRQKDTFE